jgi:hypothetical protein
VNNHRSWEQTVEDLAAELYHFDRLHELRDFGHLFVRVGIDGLVHIRNEANRVSGHLYFAADRDPGSQLRACKGTVAGKNTLVIASVLQAMLAPANQEIWSSAIIDALRAIRRAHRAGYDGFEADKDPDQRGQELVKQLVKGTRVVLGIDTPDCQPCPPAAVDDFVGVEIPGYVFTEPQPGTLSSGKRWRILDETLLRRPPHRVHVALAIAKAGHHQVMNRQWAPPETRKDDVAGKVWETLGRPEFNEPHDRQPDFMTLQIRDYPPVPDRRGPKAVETPNINWNMLKKKFSLNTPIARFGDLVAADRDEIESLNSVANLFRNYIGKNNPASRHFVEPLDREDEELIARLSKDLRDAARKMFASWRRTRT